ncbi:MAG: hypothetical protein WCV62_01005 [Candidatus Peribacteraceae bacterium]|jgi:hypothetical protein
MPQAKVSDCYLLDTYRTGNGTYSPGAITFCGRKRMEVLRWKEAEFETEEEANAYVRRKLAGSDMRELGNEGELRAKE